MHQMRLLSSSLSRRDIGLQQAGLLFEQMGDFTQRPRTQEGHVRPINRVKLRVRRCYEGTRSRIERTALCEEGRAAVPRPGTGDVPLLVYACL